MIHAVVINAKGGGRALKRMLTLKHECPEAFDSIPWLEAETVSEAALFFASASIYQPCLGGWRGRNGESIVGLSDFKLASVGAHALGQWQ